MKRIPKIFLVEDEVELAELVRDYLLNAGYEVIMRHSGEGVIDEIRTSAPDLMLLDLMLPVVDGHTICREIRSFSELPIIMLTARVEEIDRLLGLEMGADDYICKPFRPREVVARVKAVLRRTLGHQEQTKNTCLQFDEAISRVSLNGTLLDLTRAECRLLYTLASRPAQVFSRSQLLDAIYDDYRAVSDRSVDSHIKNLRRKLGSYVDGDNPIHSVYGVGYKLEL